MFYRRKIILALFQQFGGSLTKTDFQKLLFLLSQETTDNHYDFVPYKFGCFSFQAQQDVSTMIKYGQIIEDQYEWKKVEKKNYLSDLKMKDRIDLVRFFNKYKDLKGDSLIQYIYNKYPYYAINSEIAEKILNVSDLAKVKGSKPTNSITALYTIGYEGKSVENFANRLIEFNIKVLCDVRKNSKSMKYGFSKNQLKNVVENVNIQYIHLPELGIQSDKRRNLNSYDDYKALFEEYVTDILPYQQEAVRKINTFIERKKRVALTCFEADYNYCHRSTVADAVSKIQKEHFDVIHI